MAKPEIIVLTNCTNRKRKPVQSSLRASSLPRGSFARTSQEWVERIQGAKRSFIANQLYCGRVVTETLSVGEALGAEVLFVSAGLGIVPQFQKVPAYSLTASHGHSDSVCDRITEPYDPASWWMALAKAQGTDWPLARFIEYRGASLVLVAMPASYLSMVAREFADLTPKVLRTIRLIGPRHQEDVNERLQPSWLPYDARLDSPETGINGTASDFPHRALRHFAKHILPKNRRGTSQSHAKDVQNALSRFRAYIRPRGQSASDKEVISEIVTLWKKHDGCRSGILRELRSVRRIACEQSRFSLLADQVAARLNASS